MPRYLIQVSYTAEAAAVLAGNPQDRTEGFRALLERLGARLESLDYALGEYDVVATYEAPDDTAATAISLAALAPGHLRAFRTTKLISQGESLEASRRASGAGYGAPTRK